MLHTMELSAYFASIRTLLGRADAWLESESESQVFRTFIDDALRMVDIIDSHVATVIVNSRLELETTITENRRLERELATTNATLRTEMDAASAIHTLDVAKIHRLQKLPLEQALEITALERNERVLENTISLLLRK